jgi:secreted PhoX family phosphatase
VKDLIKTDPLQQMLADNGDEPLSNRSANPSFDTILQRRASRRGVMGGTLGAAVAGIFAASPVAALARGDERAAAAAADRSPLLGPKLGFDAVPVGIRSDTATLPMGYKAQALAPWGTPLTGSLPAFDAVNGNTGAEQEQQVGSHHDGMHYFPFADDPNGHGLLCVNHEYVDQRVFHAAGPTFVEGQRPTDEVRKEIAGHGMSVIEVRRDGNGVWDVVAPSVYNRRVTAGTVCEIAGPVRGSDYVKTLFSPDGTRTRGTLNNCAHGYTPWNTYLTCEENWAGYFKNDLTIGGINSLFTALGYAGTSARVGDYFARFDSGRNEIIGVIDEEVDQKPTARVYTQAGSEFTVEGRVLLGTLADLQAANGIVVALPREQARYGVRTTSSRYGWETAQSGEDAYVRFDLSIKAADATEDYRNEVGGQGWILEVDPFNPKSTPKKRTALGRFAHEGVVFAPARNFEPLAFYSGDDARNEYIYKFVTKQRWFEARPNRNMLDEGTLYAAVFNDDGSGEWRALDINDPAFRAAAAAAGVEFVDQADVLINTRLAADVVGATKMDRPEWGAVHPHTRDVYFCLTNNSSRTVTDAANPRPNNVYGQIVRWREQGRRAAATTFQWDLFALAGPIEDSQVMPGKDGPALTPDNIFASPDGIWVDNNGILWIQTDMSGSQQLSGPFGENQMLAANPVTGEIRRFLVGPEDQETTGVVTTPDGKTMFVNFQHPGDRSQPGAFTSNWPDSGAVYRHPGDAVVTPSPTGPRPRSATLVITREDGGVIGL